MSSTTLRISLFVGAVLVLPCWVAACSGDDSTVTPNDADASSDASTNGDTTIPADADDTLDAEDPLDARARRDGGRGDGGRFDGGRRDGGRDGAVDEDAALDSGEDAD